MGLKIIRFSESIAVKNPELIENAILKYIMEYEEKSPHPPFQRGS
jgi:hypothetical protein